MSSKSSQARQIKEQMYLARLTKLDKTTNKFPTLKYAMTHHLNIRKQKMTFDDKPYLIGLYTDNTPRKAIQSSVQTGKSEYAIIKALEEAERGLQCMYVLPTSELRNLFVANRVDKTIESVPHYQKMMSKGSNIASSRGLKHFGDGAIFFAGSNSQSTFVEKPLDLIIADELDQFDFENYAKADDRMTASPYKMKIEVGNPSVEKYGINRAYRTSDQKELFIKCPCCNHWQRMKWFKNVVRQIGENEYQLIDRTWRPEMTRPIRMYCSNCWHPINRYTHSCAWVAKHPGLPVAGYKIHQMMSAYVEISEMWAAFKKGLSDETMMQVFFNSVLGETFAAAGSKLDNNILGACIENYTLPASSEGPCFMGVDVGKRLNVVIRQLVQGERLKLVYASTVKDFSDLDYLFNKYSIAGYVLDGMPETRKSREAARRLLGRGWICRYNQGLLEVRKTQDDEGQVVSADRTMVMDRVLSFYMQRKYINPSSAPTLDGGDYYDQLKNPTRVFDKDRVLYNWVGDEDHYYHAEVYALLAYICRGEFKVTGISTGQPQAQRPDRFEDLPIPPNADPGLVAHYRNLYEKIGETPNG